MAIKLTDKTNTEGASVGYPYGDIRDNPGNNSGTPVNREVYGDFHQFFERMMAFAGVTHNGLPDNASNGFQLFDAMRKIFVQNDVSENSLSIKVFEIGAWDMNADQEKEVFFGGFFNTIGLTKMVSVSVTIIQDAQSYSHNLLSNTGETTPSYEVDGNYQLNLNSIVLQRKTGGNFDDLSYNNTGINRGFITITYRN